MSIHCPKMISLTFDKCDLVDYIPREDINSDQEYERKEAFIEMAREAYKLVGEFNFLEAFTFSTTPISSRYLVFLLARAPNLKTIDIGPKSDICDETMMKIILQNPLTQLEEFHCTFWIQVILELVILEFLEFASWPSFHGQNSKLCQLIMH